MDLQVFTLLRYPMEFLSLYAALPPELEALRDIPQDPIHHPEGDALIHTFYVVDAMADIIDRNYGFDYSIYSQLELHESLLYAALCHDLGKALTTEIHDDGRITAYGHPEMGIKPTRTLLEAIGISDEQQMVIVPLVQEHMAWVGYFTPEITPRAIRRLANRLMPATIEQWALLVEADISGRPPKTKGLPQKAYDMLVAARELGINEGI